MHVAMNVLTPQVGVHLGIGNLVAREFAERPIHGVVSAQRSKDVTVHKIVERSMTDALGGIGKQREVETAVEVFFLTQVGMVDALHD